MGDLDKHLRNLPIIYLAIPGKFNHDYRNIHRFSVAFVLFVKVHTIP